VNAYLARGAEAVGVRAGTSYVDIGTLNGYRNAITLLGSAGGANTSFTQTAPLMEAPKPAAPREPVLARSGG
jgi:glucose-1-phosphate thymidylyltransferase